MQIYRFENRFQFKENFVSRTVNNPYNPKNRDILNESYGIQLPLIVDRKPKVILLITVNVKDGVF